MSLAVRLFAALLAIAAASGVATAQIVKGKVVDAETKLPIALVEVKLLAENDATLDLTLSSDSGTFLLKGAGAARYAVDLRRVGFERLTTTHIRLAPGDTMIVSLEMGRTGPVMLDTIKVEERRSFWSSVTAGRSFVQTHARRGIGLFVAGSLVERSGLLLSEYLGRMEGLTLSSINTFGFPVIPARGGMFLTSTFPSRCLYARVDRQSLAHYLITSRHETIDDALKLNQIAAIEIYRDRAEIPEEWKDAGYVKDMFFRMNGGTEYLLGHPGNTEINEGMLSEDAFGARSATRDLVTDRRTSQGNLNNAQIDKTKLVTRENMVTPQCGFLQIWTNKAW